MANDAGLVGGLDGRRTGLAVGSPDAPGGSWAWGKPRGGAEFEPRSLEELGEDFVLPVYVDNHLGIAFEASYYSLLDYQFGTVRRERERKCRAASFGSSSSSASSPSPLSFVSFATPAFESTETHDGGPRRPPTSRPKAEGRLGSPRRRKIRRTTGIASRHPQHHELTGVEDIATSSASTTSQARINVADDSVAARHFHRLTSLFWFVRWVQSTEQQGTLRAGGLALLAPCQQRQNALQSPHARLDEDRGSKTQAAHGKEEGQSTEQHESSRWARREGEVGRWMNSRWARREGEVGRWMNSRWATGKPRIVCLGLVTQ
ncbi:hypothetical protein TIFTF001_045395 [Ficus carica]|uniref:Uncharacterized protein n=1 Tax=Ficus carica TaxID=3494 RepID=A0AA88CL76_FICCA|nr:hypothetical protein TIFTF001_045395 [Ficus carica]